MKSFVCFAMLAVLAGVQCARVPAHEHGVGRVRRSINPWDLFNNNKKTKKIVKKKPMPKPTTQATTPITPALTTTPSGPRDNVTVKNKMPEYIAEKMGKLKTKDQVMRFLGITASMSQKINVKKTLPISGVSGQSSGVSGNLQNYVEQWTSIDCLPRPQVIHFPQRRLYHGIIYPYGAMAFRCSGCCVVSMHHCVPVKVKSKIHIVFFVPYSIMVSSQRSSRKKRNSNSHVVLQIPVENHETCKCQCKVGPQYCDPHRQYHDESTCQCKCRDEFTESRMNCTKPFMYDKETCNCECAYHHRHCPSARQQWDRKGCKCTCDDRIRCPMGLVMNKNCECEDIQMSDKVPNCKKSNTQ